MQAATDFEPETRNRSGEHILISLTYIAKKTEVNSGMELTRALEHWRRYFEESGISSALVFNENYFIQNVQGSRPAVNHALAKIVSEYLDILPNVIGVEEIVVRRWDGFLIKYLTSSIEDEEYALKSFSAGSDFNPYLMKNSQIASFLKAVFADEQINKI
ncbi:BLUF domain-containing protein [Psychrobacter aquimaris]|uniref:BLUF domain-containing protein n=1 Tax=Psychrobacter aquimaris TaxID=292733 RepID=UPI0018DFD89A|nr:BLUF domain-containing protein [Psychrobacter aquimaris]